jgi:hypothetical protein
MYVNVMCTVWRFIGDLCRKFMILNKMWAEIKSKHCMGLYLKEMLLRRLRIYIVCVYVAASHRRVDVQADLYHTMSPVAYLSVEQSVYVTE